MIRRFENYLGLELKDAGITVGTNVSIASDVVFHNPHNIIIGNNSRIDSHCILSVGKDFKLIIGDNVHIAPGCYLFGGGGNIVFEDYSGLSSKVVIYTASDDYTEGYMTNPTVDPKFRKLDQGDVILKKHVVVGTSSIILPNITLAFATSVGANSLVTKSTNDFDFVFGSPAKFVKKRKNVYLT